MVGALWYLRVHSIIGRVKSRLKRLKQPKYLAGAVVGAIYFYLVFFRRAHVPHVGGRPGSPPAPADALPADVLPVLGEIGAFILLLVLVLNWLFPRRAALPFSESEIAFLFPAPVTRRMLVNYRLLGQQLGLFFTALVFTVVFGRGRAAGVHGAYQFVGWWLVLALVNLHFTGTSFFYSRLLNPSITSARRRVVTFVAGAAVLVALVGWVAFAVRLPVEADLRTASDVAGYVTQLLHAGPLPWLLALPKLMVAPYFATTPGRFALTLIPAMLLLAAHYFWVVHTEVAFEEASIARAEKRSARKRAVQQGDWRGQVTALKARTPAFELRSIGRPELAFLWKNLLATGGLVRPWPILALAAGIVAVCSWIARDPDLVALDIGASIAVLAFLGMTLLLGPQVARQDLRADLANADLLKTYPLRGWQIVGGEMLAPVAILSIVFWLGLLAECVLVPADFVARFPRGVFGAAAFGLALLAPPFLTIQLLMPNAAAVLFPAWVHAARDQTERGIEVMGQRMILLASLLLVTALVLLPALLVGALVFFLVNFVAGVAAGAVAAALAMAALMGGEAWLGIRWLGRRFEALDISSELRA